MLHSEFRDGLERLMAMFGNNHFAAAKADRIYDLVKDLTPEEWNSVIDHLTDNCKYAPSIADVKKAALPYFAQAAQRRKKTRLDNLSERCTLCENSGTLFAHDREKPQLEYQFGCVCSAGTIVGFNPRWDHEKHNQKFCRVPLSANALAELQNRQDQARGIPRRPWNPNNFFRGVQDLVEATRL